MARQRHTTNKPKGGKKPSAAAQELARARLALNPGVVMPQAKPHVKINKAVVKAPIPTTEVKLDVVAVAVPAPVAVPVAVPVDTIEKPQVTCLAIVPYVAPLSLDQLVAKAAQPSVAAPQAIDLNLSSVLASAKSFTLVMPLPPLVDTALVLRAPIARVSPLLPAEVYDLVPIVKTQLSIASDPDMAVPATLTVPATEQEAPIKLSIINDQQVASRPAHRRSISLSALRAMANNTLGRIDSGVRRCRSLASLYLLRRGDVLSVAQPKDNEALVLDASVEIKSSSSTLLLQAPSGAGITAIDNEGSDSDDDDEDEEVLFINPLCRSRRRSSHSGSLLLPASCLVPPSAVPPLVLDMEEGEESKEERPEAIDNNSHVHSKATFTAKLRSARERIVSCLIRTWRLVEGLCVVVVEHIVAGAQRATKLARRSGSWVIDAVRRRSVV